jgi:hypothetical protein
MGSCGRDPFAKALTAVKRIGRIVAGLGERDAREVGERVAGTEIKRPIDSDFAQGFQRCAPIDGMCDPCRQTWDFGWRRPGAG